MVAAGIIAVLAAGTPSGSGGLVTPAPVKKMVTGEPRGTGLLELFRVPSGLRAFASPDPDPSDESSPSAVGTTIILKTLEAAALVLTCTAVLDCPAIPAGTIHSILPLEIAMI